MSVIIMSIDSSAAVQTGAQRKEKRSSCYESSIEFFT
jgi:hypothetical protein